jgi:hypothetical protein
MNIGSQKAREIINNDHHIEGGPWVSLGEARSAAESLQQAWAWSGRRELAAMRGPVDAIAEEMRRPTPDRHTVADRVRKLIDLISASASVASLGAAIADPLRMLAGWLGDLGGPILQMLI